MCMHTQQVRVSKKEQEVSVGPMQIAETYEDGIPTYLLPSRNTRRRCPVLAL